MPQVGGYHCDGGRFLQAAFFQQIKDRTVQLSHISAMPGDDKGFFTERGQDALGNEPVGMNAVELFLIFPQIPIQGKHQKRNEKNAALLFFDAGNDGAGITECFPGMDGKIMITDDRYTFQCFPVSGTDGCGNEYRYIVILAQADTIV